MSPLFHQINMSDGKSRFIVISLMIIGISLLILSFSIIFNTSNLLFEAILSMSPILTIIAIIGITLVTFLIYRYELQKYKFYTGLLSFTLLFLLIPSYFLLNFGVFSSPQALALQKKGEIRTGFFNKYFENQNYDEIAKTVNSLNLDIFGMSEISFKDYEVLKSKLNFKYSLILEVERDYTFSNAIFSNFELTELRSIETIGGIILNARAKDIGFDNRISIIHLSTPVTQDWLIKRNKAYASLQGDIIMGDFNTTPWSPVFRDFLRNRNEYKNAANGRGFFCTWNCESRILGAQIDHIFYKKNSFVSKSFQSIQINGSDHNLILSKLELLD